MIVSLFDKALTKKVRVVRGVPRGDICALLHERGECEPHAVVEVELQGLLDAFCAIRTDPRQGKHHDPDGEGRYADTDPHLPRRKNKPT